MNVPVPKVKMTVPEFLAWAESQSEGRFELVDGTVVAMAPERVRHSIVKFAVARALDDAVQAAKLPCTVFTDGPAVVINNHKTREPDASVQCGLEVDLDAMNLEAPLIVVEVVSPTSERTDASVKLADYFSVPSIRHYLLIYPEPDVRLIIHHTRNGSRIDTRISRPDEEVVLDPPGFSVPVNALLGPPSLSDPETPKLGV